MKDFIFGLSTKVVFGEGAAKNLVDICKSINASKVFIVTGRTVTRNSPYFLEVLALFEEAGIKSRVFSEVEADPSVETIDTGAAALQAFGADAVVGFGGGSPMDAAKSMCMVNANGGSIREYLHGQRSITKRGIPLICIPTTAGTGSEVTAAAVTSDKETQQKIGVSHEFMMPMLAIVDPILHVSMPPSVTAATGIDALTHAIEAFVAVKANPITDGLAIQAIRMIGDNLRLAYGHGENVEVRSKMALASLIAGTAFTNAGLGAVHGIAHSVGARFGVAHGMANGIVLPYVMEYYWMDKNPKFKEIAAALGEDVKQITEMEAGYKAVEAVNKLKTDLGIPKTLADVNIKSEDLEDIAQDAAIYRSLSNSPRHLGIKDLRIIVDMALKGKSIFNR